MRKSPERCGSFHTRFPWVSVRKLQLYSLKMGAGGRCIGTETFSPQSWSIAVRRIITVPYPFHSLPTACKNPTFRNPLTWWQRRRAGGGGDRRNIRAKTSSGLMNLHCNLSVSRLFPACLNHFLLAQTSTSFLSLPWGIFFCFFLLF